MAHRTSETESGLWPTPTVFDSIAENMMPKNGDTTRLDKFGKARKVLRDGRTASMGLARLVAHNAAIVTNSLLSTDATLLTSVIAHDAKVTANAIWPTPRARDYKDGETIPPSRKLNPELATLGQRVIIDGATGGTLNPMWVEWLMGWPLGWTDLKPLETDKFQKWLEQHGKS